VRSRRNLPIFIGYGVISALVLGYLAMQMGGEFFFDRPYTVKAEFASAAELVPGDDVTIAGLRVGKIDWIQPGAGGGASAQLLIHGAYAPLFRDARAVVQQKNLLGEAYVELNRGSSASGPMPDGGTIAARDTLTPVEVDQILSVLDNDTRDRLTLLINTLGEATAGNGENMNVSAADLHSLAGSLSRIATAVAAQSTDLDTLISSLTKVMQTIAAWHAEFRAMITDWDRLMAALAQREQDLEGTIQQNARVMTIFDQALSGSAAGDLHDAIAHGPQAIDNANHYLTDANVVYPELADNSNSIAALFYELASVMSGVDPTTGKHMWRVYVTQDSPGAASVPCNPYLEACGVNGQPITEASPRP
jgi:virulence factor Mce-like protein